MILTSVGRAWSRLESPGGVDPPGDDLLQDVPGDRHHEVDEVVQENNLKKRSCCTTKRET